MNYLPCARVHFRHTASMQSMSRIVPQDEETLRITQTLASVKAKVRASGALEPLGIKDFELRSTDDDATIPRDCLEFRGAANIGGQPVIASLVSRMAFSGYVDFHLSLVGNCKLYNPNTNQQIPLDATTQQTLNKTSTNALAAAASQISSELRTLNVSLRENPYGCRFAGCRPEFCYGNIVFDSARTSADGAAKLLTFGGLIRVPQPDRCDIIKDSPEQDEADTAWQQALSDAGITPTNKAGKVTAFASRQRPDWADSELFYSTAALGRRVDRYARELVKKLGDPTITYEGVALYPDPTGVNSGTYVLFLRKKISVPSFCTSGRLVIHGPLPWNWYFECTQWSPSSIDLSFLATATPVILGGPGTYQIAFQVSAAGINQQVSLASVPNAKRAELFLSASSLSLWTQG